MADNHVAETSRLPPISSLFMSPPEGELLQSFNSSDAKESTRQTYGLSTQYITKARAATPLKQGEDPTHQPPSPPESPATPLHPRSDNDRSLPLSSLSKEIDPLLYPKDGRPGHNHQSHLGHTSLFPTADSIDAAIRRHLNDNAMHYMKGKSRGDTRTLRYQLPTLEDYRLALSFKSHMSHTPEKSLKRAREEDAQNYPNAKRLGVHAISTKAQLKPTTKLPSPPATPTRLSKAASHSPQKKPAVKPRLVAISRAAPGEGGRSSNGHATHTRVREPKKPIDVNWRAIQDCAPSTELLAGNAKALKVDWDGNALDLSNDPDHELLHEAELNLASALRLTCARYLTCKRRIFVARVEALKIGKEFKKTDAQQACQIDVNKASKLWMAYDKAGWLQPHLFKQYL